MWQVGESWGLNWGLLPSAIALGLPVLFAGATAWSAGSLERACLRDETEQVRTQYGRVASVPLRASARGSLGDRALPWAAGVKLLSLPRPQGRRTKGMSGRGTLTGPPSSPKVLGCRGLRMITGAKR